MDSVQYMRTLVQNEKLCESVHTVGGNSKLNNLTKSNSPSALDHRFPSTVTFKNVLSVKRTTDRQTDGKEPGYCIEQDRCSKLVIVIPHY